MDAKEPEMRAPTLNSGTKVRHQKLGTATVQPLIIKFHPHHNELGLCFIKLDQKPEHFSTDVIEAFVDDLEII
jgi:hypothetical protein